jgi:N-acetylneuraminic acid mutarotase
MLEKRAYFYACSIEINGIDNLYAFGGKNRDGPLSSIEKYDPKSNQWFKLSQQIPCGPIYAHSGCTINSKVFISGGYSISHYISEFFVYDPSSDQWQHLASMNTPRGWHSICAVNDKIYSFGGCHINTQITSSNTHPNLNSNNQITASTNHHTDLIRPVLESECYCTSNNEWKLVKHMDNFHKEASCLVKDDRFVFVFGGYNIHAKMGQKLVSKYDTKTDTWTTVGQFQYALTGSSVVMLDFPYFIHNGNNTDKNLSINHIQMDNLDDLNSYLECINSKRDEFLSENANLDSESSSYDEDELNQSNYLEED